MRTKSAPAITIAVRGSGSRNSIQARPGKCVEAPAFGQSDAQGIFTHPQKVGSPETRMGEPDGFPQTTQILLYAPVQVHDTSSMLKRITGPKTQPVPPLVWYFSFFEIDPDFEPDSDTDTDFDCKGESPPPSGLKNKNPGSKYSIRDVPFYSDA
jgi:hypothetical protein